MNSEKKLDIIIKKAKSDFFKNKLQEAESDSRKLWSISLETVNLNLSKNKKEVNNIIRVNNVIITDKQEIVNNFNNYFINIGTNLNDNQLKWQPT